MKSTVITIDKHIKEKVIKEYGDVYGILLIIESMKLINDSIADKEGNIDVTKTNYFEEAVEEIVFVLDRDTEEEDGKETLALIRSIKDNLIKTTVSLLANNDRLDLNSMTKTILEEELEGGLQYIVKVFNDKLVLNVI